MRVYFAHKYLLLSYNKHMDKASSSTTAPTGLRHAGSYKIAGGKSQAGHEIDKAQAMRRAQERPIIYRNRDEERAALPPAPPKLIGGVFFWLILGLTLTDDLIDIVFSAIQLLFTAAVITIPLGIVIWILSIMISGTMFIIIHVFFMAQGGLHSSAQLKRLAAWFFAISCEMIPVLQLLPTVSIMFVLIVWLENKIRKSSLLAHAMAISEKKRRR